MCIYHTWVANMAKQGQKTTSMFLATASIIQKKQSPTIDPRIVDNSQSGDEKINLTPTLEHQCAF
jgi:hypothetical protein